MMNLEEFKNTYPVTISFPIAWGEMDSFQHINNVCYFRYMESVRISYFLKAKIVTLDQLKKMTTGPILANTSCKFIRPLHYPDEIYVGTISEDFQKDRFTMKYGIWSKRWENLAAIGDGLIVSFDYKTQKKVPLPQDWLDGINALQK